MTLWLRNAQAVMPWVVRLYGQRLEINIYASVATFTSQPGKLGELLTAFRDKIVPVVKESAIQHEYILTDAKTNKVIAIALYETEAETEKMQTSGEFQRLLGMMTDTLILESITRGGYEVSIQV